MQSSVIERVWLRRASCMPRRRTSVIWPLEKMKPKMAEIGEAVRRQSQSSFLSTLQRYHCVLSIAQRAEINVFSKTSSITQIVLNPNIYGAHCVVQARLTLSCEKYSKKCSYVPTLISLPKYQTIISWSHGH